MYNTIPQLLLEKAQTLPKHVIQYSKDKDGIFQPVTYSELARLSLDFGAGLLSLGAQKGDHIGLISDNRKEWFVSSLGIMSTGCCDIPRGSEATVKDLSYILSFAECKIVIAENSSTLKKIAECQNELKSLENIILIDSKNADTSSFSVPVITYQEVLQKGKEFRSKNENKIEEIINSVTQEETATIIFTSGSTGTPKGVELTHKNFLCQLEGIGQRLHLKTGDKTLCVLPVWHVYEREMEYFYLYKGISMCYSKPVPSIFLTDMQKTKPQFFSFVPRIWDAVYKAMEKKVLGKSTARKLLFNLCTAATKTRTRLMDIILGRNQQLKKPLWIKTVFCKVLYIPCLFLLPLKALGEMLFFRKAREVMGGAFKLGLSGGGGLPPKLDRFFNSIGMKVLEGYGLTETAPICTIRKYRRPVLGTIGSTMPYCELKVVNRHGVECGIGQLGVLYVRGENVMKCYYKQPELTNEVIKEGWFNTGDLVIMTNTGDVIVKGRAKDTIVLRSGENVEPAPIESKLIESPYINQAVVVGQDKNYLGALLLPQKEAILSYAKEQGLDTENFTALLRTEKIHDLIFKEMERLITPKNGFKPFEKIARFAFIDKQFEVGTELSAKGTIVRYKIEELYKWQIAMMFSDSQLAQGLSQGLSNLSNMIPTNIKIPKLPGKKK